jgi:hypothetical protein
MTNSLSITDLKLQKRWVLWRLENTAKGKPTKRPYQPDGRLASSIDPATWKTFAELEPHVSKFSGIGLVLGTVDGVSVWGVDIDRCCDVATGKFSPESREVVIALDTYTEYSPSGTGCHLWGIGTLPGAGIQKPFPGAKQIEVKADGYYQTYTGRYITKTPASLEDRQVQVTALYHRANQYTKPAAEGLTVAMSLTEEERFQKLMAGDTSAHNNDHSAADFALCILLAKKYGCNAFKIDDEFRKSGLYRDKWERDDYRENTITRAVLAVLREAPISFGADEGETFIEDDGTDKWVVDPLDKRDGWFPAREVSLVGGGSGSGKTYWVMTMLEQSRIGADFLGHKTVARDYRVLMHDRGVGAMRRTLAALGLSAEAKERVIRLSPKQQGLQPGEVLDALCERNPGVEVWFIEGLDFWFPDVLKMSVVAPILDALHRVATRRNIVVLATVGAPKEKIIEGKANARYYGRDALFGSAALARKVDTVVLISKTDMDDENAPRQYTICKRNGGQERFWMSFVDDNLCAVDRPESKERVYAGPPSKAGLLKRNVFAKFKIGDRITYSPELGVAKKTYYDWLPTAVADGFVEHRDGIYRLAKLSGTVRGSVCATSTT